MRATKITRQIAKMCTARFLGNLPLQKNPRAFIK